MDWDNFKGFQAPNTTQIPDDFFDHVMPHLSEAELKVLLYIFRRTLGFKKERDAISYSQFLEGIRKRDGTQLDEGAGIKPTALKAALRSLQDKHLIFKINQIAEDGGAATTIYELNLGQYTEQESNPQDDTPPGRKTTYPWSKSDHTPTSKNDHTINSINNKQRGYPSFKKKKDWEQTAAEKFASTIKALGIKTEPQENT